MSASIVDKMAEAIWISIHPAELASDADMEVYKDAVRRALGAVKVDDDDLRRLASGEYILCDGYCQGD